VNAHQEREVRKVLTNSPAPKLCGKAVRSNSPSPFMERGERPDGRGVRWLGQAPKQRRPHRLLLCVFKGAEGFSRHRNLRNLRFPGFCGFLNVATSGEPCSATTFGVQGVHRKERTPGDWCVSHRGSMLFVQG